HQDDAIALGLQRLAGLRARVVELAGLADDDRAGADDQDRLEVATLWHGSSAWQSDRRDSRYRADPGSLPDAPGSKRRGDRCAPVPGGNRRRATRASAGGSSRLKQDR